MAVYTNTVRGDADRVAAHVDRSLTGSLVGLDLVHHTASSCGGARVLLYVYDKYYFRNGNRASLTVQYIGQPGGTVQVTAVGSGGGSGLLFNFSWGAEGDFVGAVERALEDM